MSVRLKTRCSQPLREEKGLGVSCCIRESTWPTNLVVDHVVRALIDTLTVSAMFQSVTDILNIGNTINNGGSRPARAPSRNRVKVDFIGNVLAEGDLCGSARLTALGTVGASFFHRTLEATGRVPSGLWLVSLVEVRKRAER